MYSWTRQWFTLRKKQQPLVPQVQPPLTGLPFDPAHRVTRHGKCWCRPPYWRLIFQAKNVPRARDSGVPVVFSWGNWGIFQAVRSSFPVWMSFRPSTLWMGSPAGTSHFVPFRVCVSRCVRIQLARWRSWWRVCAGSVDYCSGKCFCPRVFNV